MEKAAQQEFKQHTSNASIIGVSAFAGAMVGFVLQLLIAYFLGAGKDTDAFFMAQSTSDLFSKVLLGGSIVSLFTPIFIEQATQKNKEVAWHSALTVMHIIGACYLGLLLVTALFVSPFVHAIAPGFSPETANVTIRILFIMMPAFFFLFLTDLATSILYAVKHFTIPALLRIVAPAISAICVGLLASRYGIFSLAIGVLLGSIAQLGLVAYALAKQGFTYYFIWNPNDPIVRRLVQLVSPFIISMIITQAAGIIYRILASHLEVGSLSALKYAEKITQLVTVMFLTSITTVIYPTLSEKASKHGSAALLPVLASATRLMFFISVPLTVALCVLRIPLVTLFFQRGSFTSESTAATSIALFYLALGLVTNGISALYGNATLALQKTKASVLVTALSQGVAILFFVILTPLMGLGGLALGSSLVPIAITAMYVGYLSRFIPNILHAFWHRTYGISIVLGALIAVAMTYTYQNIHIQVANHKVELIVQVVISSVIGIALYFGGGYLLHVPEMRIVPELVGEKLSKIKRLFV